MHLSDWKAYLPIYRFPPFFRNCFGCLAMLLVGIGLALFLLLPAIFSTINSLDTEPILDIPVGSFLDLDGYRLAILAVENDNRCPGDLVCTPPGSATVRFRSTLDQAEHVLDYFEDSDFSDSVSLPLGYFVRVRAIFPDSASSPAAYTVRLQVFYPAKE
jgi:hypothetical protein